MEELMLKIENVSKRYKLGEIGTTTLREELQRLGARLRGREDPTKKVYEKDFNRGETFMALDGVSLDIRKGERVGIIGHNGAGKSTLLKLISRVTAPTGGFIGLNGRVASMLEVGTGFHGELTGRENIYMNGAILGMTKREIDAKIEDIIDFSECRQFIDTPVKRYSSGMYVKLAFSVAAHLDSEIMIMDEVLAVGDMAFQKKCLTKMNDVSREEGRTILYVSHNMNTIRELCDRVIVLDHGKVVFDGGVEEGIGRYMRKSSDYLLVDYDLRHARRQYRELGLKLFIDRIQIAEKSVARFSKGEKMLVRIVWSALARLESVQFSIVLRRETGGSVGLFSMKGDLIPEEKKKNVTLLCVDISCLEQGRYSMDILAHEHGCLGVRNLDKAVDLYFEIAGSDQSDYRWHQEWWGNVHLENIEILSSV